MKTALSITERWYIKMYSNKLPSTLELFTSLLDFWPDISLKDEEIEKYGITFDETTGGITVANDATFEYDVPQPVADACRKFVDSYQQERLEKDELARRLVDFIGKVASPKVAA